MKEDENIKDQIETQFIYKQAYFWLLLIIVASILLIRLGAAPIYILDEAKNAQCAKEMLQRNDLVVPTFNDILRSDKPPLHYFFMMFSYKLFGISAYSARFFSAVMGILTILVTYFYTKKQFNAWIAFCSVVILAACTHFLFEFRLSVPDPYLIFFLTLGLFSAYTWIQEKKSLQLYIASASFGLAIMAKGPVALVLPGLCLLIWILWQKRWDVLFSKRLLPALFLMVAIALPWYISVHIATDGAWTKGFFLDHNLNRFFSPKEGHGGFFFLPVVFLLIGLFPFMSFIGEVFKNRKQVLQYPLAQFSTLVVIIFLIFFCISQTKLPNYLMPCYPFAAVVLGYFISLLLTRKGHSKKYPFYILFVFSLLVPIVGYLATGQESQIHQIRWIILTLFIVPVIFSIPLFSPKKWAWPKIIFVIFIAYSVFNILGLHFVYPMLYNQNPVAKTIHLVETEPYLIAYKKYNPGYNFYTKEFIKEYQTIDSLKYALQQHPGALIISRDKYLDSLKMLNVNVIAKHHDLFESSTTIILQQPR
jgi:4-amino-4-deoxy-L-arabinose transferase-like glycosyltransferase